MRRTQDTLSTQEKSELLLLEESLYLSSVDVIDLTEFSRKFCHDLCSLHST